MQQFFTLEIFILALYDEKSNPPGAFRALARAGRMPGMPILSARILGAISYPPDLIGKDEPNMLAATKVADRPALHIVRPSERLASDWLMASTDPETRIVPPIDNLAQTYGRATIRAVAIMATGAIPSQSCGCK
jgi:hypothetical protein